MSVVYLLWAVGSPYLKIGTARRAALDKRVMELQTGCPFNLRLLAVMPGDRHAERALHDRFVATAFRGEWFIRSDEMLAVFAVDPGTLVGEVAPARECIHCSTPFVPRTSLQTACSQRCRQRVEYLRRVAKARLSPGVCPFCDGPVVAKRGGQRFCSVSCAVRHSRAAA